MCSGSCSSGSVSDEKYEWTSEKIVEQRNLLFLITHEEHHKWNFIDVSKTRSFFEISAKSLMFSGPHGLGEVVFNIHGSLKIFGTRRHQSAHAQ